MIELGGIGDRLNPAPTSDSFHIFIASDSLGMFGHRCPECEGYWRSEGAPSRWGITCPYCGLRATTHNFLTEGQLRYVQACCNLTQQAIKSDKDGESVFDMDEVAEAVGKKCEKPKFYYAEQSQQNKYNCSACGLFNDILGRYGYCSSCGTYNGLQELKSDIARLRERIGAGQQYETCSKDVVAAFDSFARQVAKQLTRRIPMTPARRHEWEHKLFHNLRPCAEALETVFDISPFKELTRNDIDFAVLMFHRRHVYEHNGGEVDEKYIRDSGDISVRPKQVIRETSETASKIADLVLRIAQNIHNGFHAIFPPEDRPIRIKQELARYLAKTEHSK